MTQFLYNVIFLSLGIGMGLISLFNIIPFFPVVSKFSELEDITKLEKPVLLYSISRWPAIWLILLIISIIAVYRFFPEYQFGYFTGLCIALVYAWQEVINLEPNQKSKLINSLKKSLDSPPESPDPDAKNTKKKKEKYPRYSIKQMTLANWSTNNIDVSPFGKSPWECATCKKNLPIAEGEVILKGNKNRYIVKCSFCENTSIIRVTGYLFSGYHILTEARLPEYPVSKKKQSN